jgi:hypothetical protein
VPVEVVGHGSRPGLGAVVAADVEVGEAVEQFAVVGAGELDPDGVGRAVFGDAASEAGDQGQVGVAVHRYAFAAGRGLDGPLGGIDDRRRFEHGGDVGRQVVRVLVSVDPETVLDAAPLAGEVSDVDAGPR